MKGIALPSEDELAAQISGFAAKIEPDRPRWEYCLSRMCHQSVKPDGTPFMAFHYDKMARVTRILGKDVQSSRYRLGHILFAGYESAERTFRTYGMGVGALQPWLLGHVYFARVASHPHVLKVGFSRRVRSRLEDIQRRVGIEFLPPQIAVGTGADEQWWHHEWRDTRIEGEWFFDPQARERTLPQFLAPLEEDAA